MGKTYQVSRGPWVAKPVWALLLYDKMPDGLVRSLPTAIEFMRDNLGLRS